MATTHPELAVECLEDPTLFMAGTNKNLRWRCPDEGHIYECPGVRRVRGQGCPYCSNKKVLPGFNDFTTTHPDLAAECLDDPTTFLATNSKKVRWNCSLGHEYQMGVTVRANGGGCQYCSNQKVLKGFNDMATNRPDLAAECLDDATAYTAGTNHELRWRCPQGHEYRCRGADRVQGVGCGVCAGKIIIPGINDMATLRPDLAIECLADPTKYAPQSNKTVSWNCAKAGHEWEAKISNRANGRGCPICAGKKVVPGVNDLATTHPEVAQTALFDPTTITFGHDKPMPWRCDEGHEWRAPAYNRAKGTGCPYCTNKVLLPGFNDLATTHPEIAREAANFEDAQRLMSGFSQVMDWICPEEGHTYRLSPNARLLSNGAVIGCYYCSGKRALPGYNDVGTLFPDLIAETKADLTLYRPGTEQVLEWMCSLGHTYERSVYERTIGFGCPYCSNRAVLTGFNDLATTHPWLAEECLDDPTAYTAGTTQVLRWRCRDNHAHEWSTPASTEPWESPSANQTFATKVTTTPTR